jgi:hypothetical protein
MEARDRSTTEKKNKIDQNDSWDRISRVQVQAALTLELLSMLRDLYHIAHTLHAQPSMFITRPSTTSMLLNCSLTHSQH